MNNQLLDLVHVSEDAAYWSWRPGDQERSLASFRDSVARQRQLAQDAVAGHEAGLATALLGMSICLAGLGRTLEALAAAHEAVLIGREFAAPDAADHQSVLVFALVNLSLRLRDMRQDERSLAAAEEAVEQFRQLAHGDRPALEHAHATALTVVCAHYSVAGHVPEFRVIRRA